MRVITAVCSMSAVNWSRPPPLDFARGGLSFVEGRTVHTRARRTQTSDESIRPGAATHAGGARNAGE